MRKASGAAQGAALILALVSASCGAQDPGGTDSDTRFKECSDQGGSFHADDYNDTWSCDLPKPVVTVTATPTD